jgi:hypothetical protein
MSIPSNWPRNRLLLALSAGNLKRLMPSLEPIPCRVGQVLLDADSSLDEVFFPDSDVVSVVAVYENGNTIEMATIGREGCTGFQAIVGDRESSVRFLVQIPGSAAKMSRADLTRAMGSMPAFRNLMHAYVHAFLEQVLVSGACNGAHRAPVCPGCRSIGISTQIGRRPKPESDQFCLWPRNFTYGDPGQSRTL